MLKISQSQQYKQGSKGLKVHYILEPASNAGCHLREVRQALT
jgi:hypothetical protein